MNTRTAILAISTAVFMAGASVAANARDLTVVSWGGAYQAAQKKVYFDTFRQTTKNSADRRVVGRRHRCVARQGPGRQCDLGRSPG